MRLFVAAVGVSLLLACASAGNAPSDDEAFNSLSGDQLRATGATNVEAAIQELRPDWLLPAPEEAGFTREGNIEVCRGAWLVYVDGEPSRQRLRQISVREVEAVEYIRPAGMRPDGNRSCRRMAAIDVTMRWEGR